MDSLALTSSLTGWGYFLAWSISMYPQPISNFLRKSVKGLSFDYLVLFTAGFAALNVYTLVGFFDENVKKEYRRRWGGEMLVVEADVWSAGHSLFVGGSIARVVMVPATHGFRRIWTSFLAHCDDSTPSVDP